MAQARPWELDLLCTKLEANFSAHIAGTGTDPESRRRNFLSKAIAAFVLCEEAGATPQDAVAASIDGENDHGIDSVLIAPNQTLWLIQSKYIHTGAGEPTLGDVSKFCDGVKDLLQEKWDRFNPAVQAQSSAISHTLHSETCRVRVVLAHTGGAISDGRRDLFNDLKHLFNSTRPDFVHVTAPGWIQLYDLYRESEALPGIDAELELRDYGRATAPYEVFYGRLEAKRLAQLWNDYQDRLVERNIRRFKGSTIVNDGLSETLEQESPHFFYFNNGVTFLCDKITRITHNAAREKDRFAVKGLSIINGAQTVGAIGHLSPEHYDTHPAEVMATFVCLEQAPDDFAAKVTRYRNRQNAVALEDFAALDERQAMWRESFNQAGIDYLVKSGEDDPPASAHCFSATEAARYLACAVATTDWPAFVIAAKTDKNRLFNRPELVAPSDSLRNAYFRIFADTLTARQMWRTVQTGRFVRTRLRERARAETDATDTAQGSLPAAEILKHGDWLLLHTLFLRQPNLLRGEAPALTPEELTHLSLALDAAAQALVDVVQTSQWDKQARSVFVNATDCTTIKNRLMAALALQDQKAPE